eukprot:Nk52_evm8s269 gene=Nk52_evmTU8s269
MNRLISPRRPSSSLGMRAGLSEEREEAELYTQCKEAFMARGGKDYRKCVKLGEKYMEKIRAFSSVEEESGEKGKENQQCKKKCWRECRLISSVHNIALARFHAGNQVGVEELEARLTESLGKPGKSMMSSSSRKDIGKEERRSTLMANFYSLLKEEYPATEDTAYHNVVLYSVAVLNIATLFLAQGEVGTGFSLLDTLFEEIVRLKKPVPIIKEALETPQRKGGKSARYTPQKNRYGADCCVLTKTVIQGIATLLIELHLAFGNGEAAFSVLQKAVNVLCNHNSLSSSEDELKRAPDTENSITSALSFSLDDYLSTIEKHTLNGDESKRELTWKETMYIFGLRCFLRTRNSGNKELYMDELYSVPSFVKESSMARTFQMNHLLLRAHFGYLSGDFKDALKALIMSMNFCPELEIALAGKVYGKSPFTMTEVFHSHLMTILSYTSFCKLFPQTKQFKSKTEVRAAITFAKFNSNVAQIYSEMGRASLSLFHFKQAYKLFNVLLDIRVCGEGRNTLLTSANIDVTVAIGFQFLAVYGMGLQYLRMEKPLEAFECFSRSSSFFASSPIIWLRMAESCVGVHRHESAVKEKGKMKVLNSFASGFKGDCTGNGNMPIDEWSTEECLSFERTPCDVNVVDSEWGQNIAQDGRQVFFGNALLNARKYLVNAISLLEGQAFASETPRKKVTHSVRTEAKLRYLKSGEYFRILDSIDDPLVQRGVTTSCHLLMCYISLCMGDASQCLLYCEKVRALNFGQSNLTQQQAYLVKMYVAESLLIQNRERSAMVELKNCLKMPLPGGNGEFDPSYKSPFCSEKLEVQSVLWNTTEGYRACAFSNMASLHSMQKKPLQATEYLKDAADRFRASFKTLQQEGRVYPSEVYTPPYQYSLLQRDIEGSLHRKQER